MSSYEERKSEDSQLHQILHPTQSSSILKPTESYSSPAHLRHKVPVDIGAEVLVGTLDRPSAGLGRQVR
jgi:hypothetical protein